MRIPLPRNYIMSAHSYPHHRHRRRLNHCAVIGGGIIGLTTAHALSEKHLPVTIIDAGHTGASSGVAGGILSPLCPWRQPAAVTELAERARLLYPSLLRQLRSPRFPLDSPQRGMLFLGDDLHIAQAWCKQHRYTLRELNTAGLRRLAPALNAEHGFLIPEIRQIMPRQLLSALRHRLTERGVRFERTDVTGIDTAAGSATGVHTAAGTIHADCVIVCAGAWTASLIPGLDIRPIRGQIVELPAEPDILPHIVLSQGRYLIPRKTGKSHSEGCLLVGSTVEEAGFNPETTTQASNELLVFARHLLPCLANIRPRRHYAGLRPGASETPIIRPVSRVRGLFVNSGHFRNGITLAPAAAELIAQIIVGEAPCVNPQPFVGKE